MYDLWTWCVREGLHLCVEFPIDKLGDELIGGILDFGRHGHDVAGEGMGRARRCAVFAEVGAEGVTEGVEVNGSAALILFRDPSGGQVWVEALDRVGPSCGHCS